MAKQKLMDLPYDWKELSPYISEETISYHYDKHHRTYLNNLNNLIENHELASESLEDIVRKSYGNPELLAIFNNAAQVLNHDFYWLSMKPNGGGAINGELCEMINSNFGSFEAFKEQFIKIGLSQFGSGWVWLVQDNVTKKLSVTKTGNADNPILHEQTPLITCDVWEHAYYIDYRNKRAEYIEVFLDKLVNWEFAMKNLIK